MGNCHKYRSGAQRSKASGLPRLRRSRRGAAFIEFAVCLPFLMFIVLASMECTNYIFLRQAVVQSAYEGVRKAINPQSSRADAQTRISEVLTGRKINNPNVSFNPSVPENAKRGEPIEVTVAVPTTGNLLFNMPGFTGRTVTVTATMVRE